MEGQVHTLLAWAGPPNPNLPSALILPPVPSFNPAAERTPHPQPPARFSGPNFTPAGTEASPLADPVGCSGTQVSTFSPPTQPLFFSSNPKTSSPSPGHILPFPGSPQARATRGGCPTPFALPGSLGKPRVLEPSHLWASSPGGKSLLKQGPGRELPCGRHSPRTPISVPRRAVQRPGARPAPAPRALIPGNSMGLGHPTGRRRGLTVQGLPSRGVGLSKRRASVREDVRRGDRPALARGLRLRPGVGAVICMCACVCGGGGRLCA